jgi:hypothetical protein
MPLVIRKIYINWFQLVLNVSYAFGQAGERRFVPVLLLSDFSKAFDSVFHDFHCN